MTTDTDKIEELAKALNKAKDWIINLEAEANIEEFLPRREELQARAKCLRSLSNELTKLRQAKLEHKRELAQAKEDMAQWKFRFEECESDWEKAIRDLAQAKEQLAAMKNEYKKEVSNYEAQVKILMEALEYIKEYWNRNENQRALVDACYKRIEIAEEALAKVKERT